MIAKLAPAPVAEPLLRHCVGAELRAERIRQGRSLRSVAAQARISLGYLSELERGRKEASSELLAAICGALELTQARLFAAVSHRMADGAAGGHPRPAARAA